MVTHFNQETITVVPVANPSSTTSSRKILKYELAIVPVASDSKKTVITISIISLRFDVHRVCRVARVYITETSRVTDVGNTSITCVISPEPLHANTELKGTVLDIIQSTTTNMKMTRIEKFHLQGI